MSHVSIHGRGSLLLTANHESLLGSMGRAGPPHQCISVFELTTKRKEATGYGELSLAITFGGCTIVVVHYFPQAGCYLAVMPSFGMQRVVGKHDIPRYAVCWPVMLAGFLFLLVLLLLLLRRLVWLSVLGMLCCCCRHRSRSSGVRSSSSRSATPLAAAAAAT